MGSRQTTAVVKNTHQGAVLCSQMALAAVLSVIAERYVTFMAANVAQSGTNFASQRGRRTQGTSSKPAKKARQKANSTPRESSGQSAKVGALANRPLELHITAAAAIHSRPLIARVLLVDAAGLAAEGAGVSSAAVTRRYAR